MPDYSLSNTTETAPATISALSLTGSVTANSKIYDGTTAATLATRNLSGVSEVDVDADRWQTPRSTARTSHRRPPLLDSPDPRPLSAGNYTLGNTTNRFGHNFRLAPDGKCHRKQQTYDGTTAATLATSGLLTGVLGSRRRHFRPAAPPRSIARMSPRQTR